MIQFIEKMKTILKWLEKYCFIEYIEIFCSNSAGEYYDRECFNLFLKTLKK